MNITRLLKGIALALAAVSPLQAANGPSWTNPFTLPNEPGWGVADVQVIRYRG